MSDLAALSVRGPHLVACDSGTVVRLRGVNRSGLEYAGPGPGGFLASARITREEVASIAAWGANVLRLPFTQELALRGRRECTAEDYLRAIDTVIAWASGHGMYTLLDLQWLDPDTPHGTEARGVNRVPPLPDRETPVVWDRLARRYRDTPSVLFDLFNEPHDPMLDDLTPLTGVTGDGAFYRLPSRQVTMAEWQPWARHLIEVIRAVHPGAVLFVSGVRWAFDLRGFPLRDRHGQPIDGLVYSTHVYPWSRTGLVRLRPAEREWDRAFGHLAGRVPLFVGEFGGEARHREWGRRLLDYCEARDIGWAAWSWADWPCVVCDHRAGDFTPSAFGEIVRDGLRGSRST